MKYGSSHTSSSHNSTSQILETTFGELCEAVTQIALEAGKTEEEGYRLASLALQDMLRRNRRNFSVSFAGI